MGHHNKISMAMMAISVLIVSTSVFIISEAQTATPSCAQKLVPCAEYMNSTNPPATCCTPLKEAVDNELVCLCNLYNTPGLLESFGINITQALELPRHCKLSGDLSACGKVSAPSPVGAATPPVPGKDDTNGSGRIAWTWFSGILLFLASTMI